ncbi:MAG: hypothetical protein ABI333_22405 [bacterium]
MQPTSDAWISPSSAEHLRKLIRLMMGLAVVTWAWAGGGCSRSGGGDGPGMDGGADAAITDARVDATTDPVDGGDGQVDGSPDRSQQTILGGRFNAEVYRDGLSVAAWINFYEEPPVRTTVLYQLGEVAAQTALSYLQIGITAHRHIEWADPQSDPHLSNLIQFLNDARSHGFGVVINLANPCVVPNDVIPESLELKYQSYCGRRKEEAPWPIPYEPLQSNWKQEAIRWYGEIITQIESQVPDAATSVVVVANGNVRNPYGAEFRLDTENPHLAWVQEYLEALIPALADLTQLRIGIQTRPYLEKYDADWPRKYEFLDNIPAIVKAQTDFLAITSYTTGEPSHIADRLGGLLHKAMLTDFGLHDPDGLPESEILQWHFAQMQQLQLYPGGWFWALRDEHNAVGDLIKRGIWRSAVHADGGFKQAAVQAINDYSTGL